MENTLESLVDRTQIIETICRLFIGTDRRDWELVKGCLAPRVLMDLSSLGAGDAKELTPDEIVTGWRTGLASLQAIHHQAGNFLVDVDGAAATAFCYGIASHYLPNRTQRNTRTYVGSYDFALIKADGAWRIVQFKFNLKYLDGNPNLETS